MDDIGSIDNITEIDELEQLIINTQNITLEDLVIFIRIYNEPDKQFWMKFKSSYDNYTEFKTIFFKKYKKINQKSEQISTFGDINNIIYYLVKEEIYRYVPIGERKEFIIGMSDSVPDEGLCINYIIDKSDLATSCSTECPVCKSEYSDDIFPIRLHCNHKLCRDCLFGILKTNNTNCPLCRDNILYSKISDQVSMI